MTAPADAAAASGPRARMFQHERWANGELLAHPIVAHGSHHRGAAGRIPTGHAAPLPRDAPTTFLQRPRPERRWS